MQAEQEILNCLRIFDCINVYDTICLSEKFLLEFDHALSIFDAISDNSIFTSSYKVFWDINEKVWTLDNPIWFNPNRFQTISSWIVSNLEKSVWIKYYNYKSNKNIKVFF